MNARTWPRKVEPVTPAVVDGRAPPHDLDAEASVLSACMMSPALADDAIGIVRADQFYAMAHSRIFDAITELRAKGQPCDLVLVGAWMKERATLASIGGMEYLADIIDAAPTVSNVGVYANIVVSHARIRAVIIECQRVAASGYFDYGDAQTFLDNTALAIAGLADIERDDTLRTMSRVVAATVARTHAAQNNGGVVGMSTGLKALDTILGGIREGQNIVLAGRPGMGKSALAMCIGVNVAKAGHGVLVISAEMPGEELGSRLTASAAKVNTRKIMAGELTPGEWSNWTSEALAVGRLPIWIDDKAGPSLQHIRSKARKVQRECRAKGIELKLMIVDYLQLCRHSTAQSREQEIAELSRGMKEIGKEFGVAVLTLSQLNRDVEKRGDKRPQLSDLRESGSIEQDADVVGFLFRPEYYVQDRSRDTGLTEIIIGKQRGGPTGTVHVHFEGRTTDFRDLTETESMAAGVGA